MQAYVAPVPCLPEKHWLKRAENCSFRIFFIFLVFQRLFNPLLTWDSVIVTICRSVLPEIIPVFGWTVLKPENFHRSCKFLQKIISNREVTFLFAPFLKILWKSIPRLKFCLRLGMIQKNGLSLGKRRSDKWIYYRGIVKFWDCALLHCIGSHPQLIMNFMIYSGDTLSERKLENIDLFNR